jgi:hypothetical protein
MGQHYLAAACENQLMARERACHAAKRMRGSSQGIRFACTHARSQ